MLGRTHTTDQAWSQVATNCGLLCLDFQSHTCLKMQFYILPYEALPDRFGQMSDSLKGVMKSRMPCRIICCPVNKQARLQQQIAVVANALEKTTPRAARRSRFGVRISRFPITPKQFCWLIIGEHEQQIWSTIVSHNSLEIIKKKKKQANLIMNSLRVGLSGDGAKFACPNHGPQN